MVEKITLMEAYLIEHVKRNDISNQEIIDTVLAQEADRFQFINESFDFTPLHELADQMESILHTGYEIKFLTFNGLVNLLRIKFQKEKEVHYNIDNYIITNLTMSNREYQELQQLLSSNWIITNKENEIIIKPIKIK